MKSITSDWDKLAFNGAIKKGRKGSSFVSRSTGRDANGNRPSTLGKVRGLAFSQPCKLEKTVEIPVNKDKEGKVYSQPRIAGQFGKKIAISARMAINLGM